MSAIPCQHCKQPMLDDNNWITPVCGNTGCDVYANPCDIAALVDEIHRITSECDRLAATIRDALTALATDATRRSNTTAEQILRAALEGTHTPQTHHA